MYNISRSKTGGVVLKCKVCSHSERVNEFDDRLGSRRTQAAQAMLRHTRTDHGRERGQADVQSARVVGLTGDYDNLMGNAGQRFLPCTGAQWMGTG